VPRTLYLVFASLFSKIKRLIRMPQGGIGIYVRVNMNQTGTECAVQPDVDREFCLRTLKTGAQTFERLQTGGFVTVNQ